MEVGRPFAACAYEKTGGGGAPSPVGLDEVEVIVEQGFDERPPGGSPTALISES